MSQALAPRVLTKRQQEVLTQVENGINPYFTARALFWGVVAGIVR